MTKRDRGVGLPLLAVVLVLAACTSAKAASQASSSSAPPSSSTPPTTVAPGTGPPTPAPIGELPAAAAAIMAKPEFKTARWIYSVSDQETGEVLLANRPDELVFTASTAKNFTVGSLYAAVGPDATLTTPVYTTATPVDGVVNGDLVLVASGDLAMGGRGAMEGRFDHAFTATTIDHIYGDAAPNAALVPDDPLAGLDDLARQVKAAGITSIADVTIDTRIWETFEGQEGPAPSIYVNDNILDITVTGGAVGEPATLDLRPATSAITVSSTVTTTEAGAATALQVTPSPSDAAAITVSGTIAAGASQLTIYRVPDAATWARTLFVEALTRAGVDVTSTAVGPNDEASLPAKDSYPAEARVAALTSPPLEAFGTMILKTSWNTGANALMCLMAAEAGSTECIDGLKTVHDQIDNAGLVADDVILFDGQGADPASTTPAQMAAWMRWARVQPWGPAFVAGQPVLGVDGTLASAGQDSPAKGKVAAKTGTSVALDPTTNRVYYKVQSLAGYLTTDQGRNLVLALSMSGATYPDLATALRDANEDVAGVAAAIQQAFSAASTLPASITAVMNKPRYADATWSLLVTDVATGESFYPLNEDQMSLSGSTRKLFSVGAALDTLGADHRQTTPVYQQGTVAGGVLDGNLVLVGGGDLAFGGRRIDADTIEYTNFDHNDANSLGTAILTPQDPLYALDDLARQVKGAGITSVSGDVVVDSRLFEPYRVPNGELLITPTMVNENMVDVSVTPAAIADQPATVSYRPQTAALAVSGTVQTVAEGSSDTEVALSDGFRPACIGTPGCTATVSGTIPVGYQAPLTGSGSFVGTFRVEDPDTFARTAFIEALARNGVTVTAPPVAPNDASKLSASVMPGSYPPDSLVATYQSAPFAQMARLVLKVSLNLGANLSLSLLGLTDGERTVQGALATERTMLTSKYGVDGAQFNFPTNGSGTPDSQASPRALVQMLRAMSKTPVADEYLAALPVLGEDGSLATVGTTLPGKGHVFAKPGTTISPDANGVFQLKAQNLAGYIMTKSGRTVAYALMVNDAGPVDPAHIASDVGEVFEDEATISSVIYESL